jgi:hypothetical protein
MATDPESQTNADPSEYKSLQETDALVSLFYLMSDLIGPDLSVVRTLMFRRPTRSSRRTFSEKHSERKHAIYATHPHTEWYLRAGK